jgi:NhaA family Na+:H+ antiporter
MAQPDKEILERKVERIIQPPEELPIDSVLQPIQRLLKAEQTGGIILIVCTVVALVWANSPWSESYHALWETHLRIGIPGFELDKSLHHWINDGLMALFFFFVGLEIKREVLVGELASLKQAALPIAAAIGGMLVPAAIYAVLNAGGVGASGWGIPMATDIAFALGILSLMRNRIPPSLPIFLAALAIADDLGAVVVIGLFYTAHISWVSLLIAGGFLLLLMLANRMGVRGGFIYGVLGIGVWLAVLSSGVHATIAGVLVAMTIPARNRIVPHEFLTRNRRLLTEFEHVEDTVEESIRSDDFDAIIDAIETSCEQVKTPLGRMEHRLYPWVSFLILPIFALANAGVALSGGITTTLASPITLGIILGLVLGKSIGITLFSWLVVRLGIARMTDGVSWGHIYGVAWLGGIGFTMSLFIAGLAFTNPESIVLAKVGILAGSLVAAIVGSLILRSISSAPASTKPT